MASIPNWLTQLGIVTALVAAVVTLALAGWHLARRAPRVLAWTVVLLAVVGLGVLFEWFLPRRYPDFDRSLPAFAGRTWTWIYGFTIACLAATIALVQGLVRARPPAGDSTVSTSAPSVALTSASRSEVPSLGTSVTGASAPRSSKSR